LGGLFLFGTGQEWHRLISEHELTISTNLFGTTYYSLLGLHAFHVSAGMIMLVIVAIFAFGGRVGTEQSGRVEVLSLY
jgi:cytochrome c oxidase subunit 3/cytochrome o ubiquinol oxidase subunit 3